MPSKYFTLPPPLNIKVLQMSFILYYLKNPEVSLSDMLGSFCMAITFKIPDLGYSELRKENQNSFQPAIQWTKSWFTSTCCICRFWDHFGTWSIMLCSIQLTFDRITTLVGGCSFTWTSHTSPDTCMRSHKKIPWMIHLVRQMMNHRIVLLSVHTLLKNLFNLARFCAKNVAKVCLQVLNLSMSIQLNFFINDLCSFNFNCLGH